MANKTLALVLIALLLTFSYSCAISGWRPTELRSLSEKSRTNAQISAVQLTSGEHVDFPKEKRGRFVGDNVVSDKTGFDEVRIPRAEIRKIYSTGDGSLQAFVTEDGREFGAEKIMEQDKESILVRTDKFAVSIPCADVDLVWIRKVNVLSTVMVWVGVYLVLGLVVTWGALASGGWSLNGR